MVRPGVPEVSGLGFRFIWALRVPKITVGRASCGVAAVRPLVVPAVGSKESAADSFDCCL